MSAKEVVPINMRVARTKRNLIDIAATIQGKDRTSFIVEAACRQAEDTILDQRLFLVDTPAFDAFEQALNAAPDDNPRLRQLLARPSRWSTR